MPIKPSKCRLVRVFGQRVREHRDRLGMSQEELAERAGVHRTYIGMLERFEKNVTIYNIERLAKALSVTPCQLLS
jgi:transcriptional regulator with XRE-family HTH domain